MQTTVYQILTAPEPTEKTLVHCYVMGPSGRTDKYYKSDAISNIRVYNGTNKYLENGPSSVLTNSVAKYDECTFLDGCTLRY